MSHFCHTGMEGKRATLALNGLRTIWVGARVVEVFRSSAAILGVNF